MTQQQDTRLGLGLELRKGVLSAGGSDDDIALVMEEQLGFFADAGKQLVEMARTVRGDKDCFRFTDDEVVIEIPALKRPTPEEIQAIHGPNATIERDDSTEAAVTMRLATVRKSTEPSIDGPTYERRILKLRTEGRLLGFQHRRWFFANVDLLPEPAKSAVKALLGKVYIDFPAIVVVDEDGSRCIPYADYDGKQWYGAWGGIGYDFDSYGRFAVSSK